METHAESTAMVMVHGTDEAICAIKEDLGKLGCDIVPSRPKGSIAWRLRVAYPESVEEAVNRLLNTVGPVEIVRPGATVMQALEDREKTVANREDLAKAREDRFKADLAQREADLERKRKEFEATVAEAKSKETKTRGKGANREG